MGSVRIAEKVTTGHGEGEEKERPWFGGILDKKGKHISVRRRVSKRGDAESGKTKDVERVPDKEEVLLSRVAELERKLEGTRLRLEKSAAVRAKLKNRIVQLQGQIKAMDEGYEPIDINQPTFEDVTHLVRLHDLAKERSRRKHLIEELEEREQSLLNSLHQHDSLFSNRDLPIHELALFQHMSPPQKTLQ
jgi:chromosome segregation ATPase